MPVSPSRTTVKFGIFELDREARELYRNGIRVKLPPQPFELLTALLEQPGKAISRETLQQRLWPPDTYVDYEHGLNKTVRKLREALGDSVESPRYIETVQKIGYRFIAPVAHPLEPETAPSGESPVWISSSPLDSSNSERSDPHSNARWAVLTCLAILVAAAGLWSWKRHSIGESAQSSSSKTVDPRALEAYQHGRHLWFGEHPQESLDYFKRAVEVQPDYAPAWAGISLYYGAVMVRGRLDPSEGLGPQEEAAAKAIRFDPSLPEAHLALCGSIFLKTWKLQPANLECNRAAQLDPKNAEVYHFQSKMLAAVNRTQDALEVQRKSSSLDPLSRPWALGQALLQARQYDGALSEARTRLESFPHDPTLLRLLSDIYRARGNFAQSADYLEQSFRYSGDEASATQIRDTFRKGGTRAVVRWHLARLLKQKASQYVSPVDLAVDYARLGDRDQVIAMLDEALREHAVVLAWIRCEPAFDSYSLDLRYRRILEELPN